MVLMMHLVNRFHCGAHGLATGKQRQNLVPESAGGLGSGLSTGRQGDRPDTFFYCGPHGLMIGKECKENKTFVMAP